MPSPPVDSQDNPTPDPAACVPPPDAESSQVPPAGCWCCKLGDDRFDRLVREAVQERHRILGLVHSLTEEARPNQVRAVRTPRGWLSRPASFGAALREGPGRVDTRAPSTNRSISPSAARRPACYQGTSRRASSPRDKASAPSPVLEASVSWPLAKVRPGAQCTSEDQPTTRLHWNGSHQGLAQQDSADLNMSKLSTTDETSDTRESPPRVLSSKLVERCLTENSESSMQYWDSCKQHTKSRANDETLQESCLMATVKKIVTHKWFDSLVAVMILANAIVMGLDINHSASTLSSEPEFILDVLQQIFNSLFFLEWASKVYVTGCNFFRRGPDFFWNWFDTLTITISVLTEWMYSLLGAETFDWSPTSMRAARILRLARVMRVMRVSRLLSFVRSLRYLVCSIASTLQSLAWAMLLLFLVFYIFATMLTQAATQFRLDVGDTQDEALLDEVVLYWGDVLTSMFTLFMSISGGVSWIEPMRSVQEFGTLWASVFTIYISFTYFAVLNVVTGVFCEKAMQSAQDDDYNMLLTLQENRAELTQKLASLFQKLDSDASGFVTLVEFEVMMANREIRAFFEMLGIEITNAKELFRHLDTDGGGQLDVSELVEGAMKIRGPARGYDMVTVQHDLRKVRAQVRNIARAIDELFYQPVEESQLSPK